MTNANSDAVALTADVLAMAVSAGLTPFLGLELAVRFAPMTCAARLGAVLQATGDGSR